MNVFDDLDREQAAMYRWIRSRMSAPMLTELTGKTYGGQDLLDLEVDSILREAFHRYAMPKAMDSIGERSKIRSGILPPELGAAILKYTDAVAYNATFSEGLGGETHGDVQTSVTEAFKAMCNEIAKLR